MALRLRTHHGMSLRAGGMTGARPAQGAATTTGVDCRLVGWLVRGLQLMWTTGRWDDWCEAGTRRGHYNWCGLQAGGMAGGKTGARPAQGAATTIGVDYRLVGWLVGRLVRGRHKARPLQLMWTTGRWIVGVVFCGAAPCMGRSWRMGTVPGAIYRRTNNVHPLNGAMPLFRKDFSVRCLKEHL